MFLVYEFGGDDIVFGVIVVVVIDIVIDDGEVVVYVQVLYEIDVVFEQVGEFVDYVGVYVGLGVGGVQ